MKIKTPLNPNVGNNANQKKSQYRVVEDNSGELTWFDWYNARISLDFKVNLLADGANIALNDNNGVVNGSQSFNKNLDINLDGKKVYDCNDANHSVNIKNLLEYSSQYAQSTATNELFGLDTNKHIEERTAQANYNKGFAVRKALLGPSGTVNTEIPLNRYSFFESLSDEFNFEIESDRNLIWKEGADCRVIRTRLQLFIPRITFNSEGQSLYLSQYLKPHKWTYLRENVERSNSSQQRSGHFRISSSISKQRHVFVYFINDTGIACSD